ncbi:MAG: endonuclease III [Dehalococcoidia bacterium]|nr:endonuclease III [Dehalococcoidia bacterium]
MAKLEAKALREIVMILSQNYGYSEWWKEYTPFETLVCIILSQRTYWKNVDYAMREFTRRFNDIKSVAQADIEDIEEAIKPAGFYHTRASGIKKLALSIANKYNGTLDDITNLTYVKARQELLSLKGIGRKTADVFLMALKESPVIPIDVHIFRIMRRLGMTDGREGYDALRARMESLIPPAERKRGHMTLIEFGRETCHARNPRCDECPIADYCHSDDKRL